jgi:GNAT superfamily N-acetyltransferase
MIRIVSNTPIARSGQSASGTSAIVASSGEPQAQLLDGGCLWHSAAVLANVRRLRRYLQTNGARRTAAAIWSRLRRLAYLQERVIVIVGELDSIVVPWREADLRLVDLRAEHLPELAELNRRRGRPEVDARFARYVADGFHGFVAYGDDQLVGYYWWVDRDGPTLFPDLRKRWLGIELGEGDVYGSDFFLLDEHRGRGVADDFLYRVERSLHERGYSRLWGYVASDNRPARWIYSTRGYVPMWTVKRSRLLMIQRTSREPS